MINISSSKKKSPYFAKDQEKFKNCNRLIARGSLGSSSNAYAQTQEEKGSPKFFCQSDIVGVSVEGARRGRICFDIYRVNNACLVNATIICDKPQDRERQYNVGERRLVHFLHKKGYEETSPGVFNMKKCPNCEDKSLCCVGDTADLQCIKCYKKFPNEYLLR